MEVKLALLADSANISKNGKLNILGQFTNIDVRSGFPFMWPSCVLVIRIEGSESEVGETHRLRIEGVNEDGQRFLRHTAVFHFEPPDNLAIPPSTGTIIQLQNIPYPEQGVYSFDIYINDRYMDSVPLAVIDSMHH